jgi:hypothetical protein
MGEGLLESLLNHQPVDGSPESQLAILSLQEFHSVLRRSRFCHRLFGIARLVFVPGK